MKYYIIGSRLMKSLFPDNERIQKRCKDTADWDFLVEEMPTKEERAKFERDYGTKIEFHVIPTLWPFFENPFHQFIMRDILFTLKASHVPWDKIHKAKTFHDLFLMSEEGCGIIEDLFYQLHQFWTEKFGQKWRADFTQESEEFFDDAVSRENLHDELHKSVAKFHQPAFKFLQEPGQTTVWVDPEKFWNADEEIRQRVVIEEAQALALERDVIPGRCKSKHISYINKVKDLVDRLAPLWMTIYIINNLSYFFKFQEDYGKQF